MTKAFILYTFIMIAASTQAAETIVDFTHRDGTRRIRVADDISDNGRTWNFSDTTLLFDVATTVRNTNDHIYGGLKPVSVDGSNTPSQVLKGMLVWNKSDFQKHSGETVVYDASSSMRLTRGNTDERTTLRFVVNNGGIYYVSKTSGSSSMTLSHPAADTWAAIDTDDYSIGTYAVRTFSDIRGVGVYFKQTATMPNTLQINKFNVSATTPEIFLVDDYGATPDDDSDDDGDSIQDCMDAAKRHVDGSGPALVRFSPGTYHIRDQQRFFTVVRKSGKDCLIIDGNGCTLMNTHAAPMGLNFRVSDSENVTIKNMTIRSEYCMWVEGVIVAVNDDDTYDVQLRSDSPAFDAWGTIEQGRETDSYGFAWPCAKGLYSAPPIGAKAHVFVKTAVDLGDGRWRVTGLGDGVTGVGDTYAMWNDWTHWTGDAALGRPTDYQSFFLHGSTNLELQNITLKTGAKMAVRSTSSNNIVIHGFRTLPDGDRSVAMARDGLNFHDSSNVLIRDCIVGFNGDDIFNGGDDGHNGSNMVIEDSLFCYSRRYVVLNPVDNFIFRNNIVYYMGGSLIHMHKLNEPNNVLLTDNEVYSGQRLGYPWTNIELLDYSDVTIRNNRLFNCKYPLLKAVSGDQLVFENNHFDRMDRASSSDIVSLRDAKNTTLVGNTTATEDDGIRLQGRATLTDGSQEAIGHDTTPKFDHARVFEILGWSHPEGG